MSALLASTQSQDIEVDGLRATKLCTHKEDVEAINCRALDALGGAEHSFVAQDSDPQMASTLDAMCPAGQVIILKTGTQVSHFAMSSIELRLILGSGGGCRVYLLPC